MNTINRRSFLKRTGVIMATTAVIPNFISCAPNTRLKFAVIGAGGRGQSCWKHVPKEDIVAMCDVDERKAANAFAAVPNSKKFKDFRVMFDQMHKEIDAVIVATPDHTHFPAAMAAMELGKHIFVEKPLAHNIWQLRTLKKAAEYYGVVSQMGNQGHTTNGIRLVKEWYDAGLLGQVREVIAWQGPINFDTDNYFNLPSSLPPVKEEIPKELDWDLWQGPVPEKDFNNIYVPRTWRGFYDYGNGKLGDWCCHTLDAPFWALDMGLPHTVTGSVPNPVADHSFVATESEVIWEFAERGNKAPLTLKWLEGIRKPELRPEWGLKEMPERGMIMIGDKHTLITGPRPDRARLLMPDEDWVEFKKELPKKTIPRVTENNPVQEWTDAIKNDDLPGSNFNYATALMEMSQVGILAQRFGGTIKYDEQNMKAIGRPELDKYIKEPVREGWSYGEGLWK